jgi:hypothetical protein
MTSQLIKETAKNEKKIIPTSEAQNAKDGSDIVSSKEKLQKLICALHKSAALKDSKGRTFGRSFFCTTSINKLIADNNNDYVKLMLSVHQFQNQLEGDIPIGIFLEDMKIQSTAQTGTTEKEKKEYILNLYAQFKDWWKKECTIKIYPTIDQFHQYINNHLKIST